MTLPAMTLLLGRRTCASPVRADDDPAAGQALADVVVGVAEQPQRDAARQERAERLARRAGERDVDGVVGQPVRRRSAGDLVAEHRADRAVDVAHRQLDPHRLAALERRLLAQLDEHVVERLAPARGPGRPCGARAPSTGASGTARIGVRSSPLAFQCVDRGRGVEQLDAARPPRRCVRKPSCRQVARGPPRR